MQYSKKAIVIFSGGQDSTTCLGWALNRFEEVETLSFDYGQRHSIELKQAKKIARILKIKNSILKINAFKELNDSALLNSYQDVNASRYNKSNLPASFVPNRNALFFTLAHAFAQKIGAYFLITGINQTDYSGYPDCREEFIKPLEKALNLGSESSIKFLYPLIRLTKAQTFKLAKQENILDLVINESHTCYNNDRKSFHNWGYGCGNCPACKLRERGWNEYQTLPLG